jgi:hypothetical protein
MRIKKDEPLPVAEPTRPMRRLTKGAKNLSSKLEENMEKRFSVKIMR